MLVAMTRFPQWILIGALALLLGAAPPDPDDFRGGTRLVYRLDLRRVPDLEGRAAEEAAAVIRERLKSYGLNKQRVKVQGAELHVEVPETDASALKRVREVVEKRGQLEFRLPVKGASEQRLDEVRKAQEKFAREEMLWVEKLRDWHCRRKETPGLAEPEPLEPQAPPEIVCGNGRQPRPILVDNRPENVVSGTRPRQVFAVVDPHTLRPSVVFDLDPEDAKHLGDLSGRNIGETLAIVLDGEVVLVATIRDTITSRAQITGDFTEEDVRAITAALQGGSLPAPLDLVRQEAIADESR